MHGTVLQYKLLVGAVDHRELGALIIYDIGNNHISFIQNLSCRITELNTQ